MNIFLFILVLAVSFVIVRIGAIAFQLTGLEWSVAKFQSLSCFTATGFTTREAELITANRQRRRIATMLIVLGHAGFVTMVATLANSLRTRQAIEAKLLKLWLPFAVPSFLVQMINLVVIIAAVYVIYRLFTNAGIARKLTGILRRRILKTEIVKPVSFEELAIATGGYGVSKILVCKGSPVTDKTLLESSLRDYDIMVLAIVRGGETIANPSADTKMLLQDELVCFGKLENIRQRIYTSD